MNCQDCNVELSKHNTGDNLRCIQCCKWNERTTYYVKKIGDIRACIAKRRENVAINKLRKENEQAIEEIEKRKEKW